MPLAHELRPNTLSEIIGQDHLLKNGPISAMAKSKKLTSFILWGPTGCSKTTIVRALANDAGYEFKELDATEAKVADIRKVLEIAEARLKLGTQYLLLLQEIHRMPKNTQDVLLPAVEEGIIILAGTTTEKPAFSVNPAILSRVLVFETKLMERNEMIQLMLKVFKHYKNKNRIITIDQQAVLDLVSKCSGDPRKLINVLETIIESVIEGNGSIEKEMIDMIIPCKHLYLSPNEVYNYAASWQNSIQNSDIDQALYFLGKWMLSGGQKDIEFIARRILISSSEDSAYSQMAQICALNAYIAARDIGYPECKIPMALATIEIAKAKHDKFANDAINEVIYDIENGIDVMVPLELRAGNHGEYIKVINKQYYKPKFNL
jgi:putative ATPase